MSQNISLTKTTFRSILIFKMPEQFIDKHVEETMEFISSLLPNNHPMRNFYQTFLLDGLTADLLEHADDLFHEMYGKENDRASELSRIIESALRTIGSPEANLWEERAKATVTLRGNGLNHGHEKFT